jgi:hypothetical protein
MDVLRRNREGAEDARSHLEGAIAERPAVEQLAADLDKHWTENHLAERVHRSMKGRP